MKIIISLLFIILSIIGIADASYLTYEKVVGSEVVCGQGFDCGEVLNSKWANIGPVPLSAFGLFFYFCIFIFSLFHFLEINLKEYVHNVMRFFGIKKNVYIKSIKPHEIVLLLSTFGFIFSIYLISLMAFVIEAWCLFCLISATTSTLLFVLSLTYFFVYGHQESVFIKKCIYVLFDIGYSFILKPIFFIFNPSTIHNFMIATGAKSNNIFSKKLLTVFFSFNNIFLEKKLANIIFPNPVGLSAGFDYNGDLTDILPSLGFGFHTIGTITLEAYAGNSGEQLVRFPKSKSILVNKGLKNIGAKKIIQKLEKKEFNIPIGISIAATNKKYSTIKEQLLDIITCFYLFEKSCVNHAYYELNISCPNTFGGEPFTTPQRLKLLIKALQSLNIAKPAFIKMPIDQSDEETLELLEVLNDSFIHGVIFGNLTKNKNNTSVHHDDKNRWLTLSGNLSGKPTFERSNQLISLTKKQYKNRFIIIGTGGIFSPEDAETKLKLGADLVQLITGMIYTGPQLIGKINQHLYVKNIQN